MLYKNVRQVYSDLTLPVGYTILWSGIHECMPRETMVQPTYFMTVMLGPTFSAINWSRFSGVGYGTLFHSRHCVER